MMHREFEEYLIERLQIPGTLTSRDDDIGARDIILHADWMGIPSGETISVREGGERSGPDIPFSIYSQGTRAPLSDYIHRCNYRLQQRQGPIVLYELPPIELMHEYFKPHFPSGWRNSCPRGTGWDKHWITKGICGWREKSWYSNIPQVFAYLPRDMALKINEW